MAELQRSRQLDTHSDRANFAVLAREWATLNPIRAWCEAARWRYALPDMQSQPRLHQVREGQSLLTLLQARPQRRITPHLLRRWLQKYAVGKNTDNIWLQLLVQFVDELGARWGDIAIPATQILEELFEFGNEARRSERDQLVLTTVHDAKGREFRHVILLDGGDWKNSNDEERRLYYVGMTRAKETLTLCQSVQRPNPFSSTLQTSSHLLHPPIPDNIAPHSELRYLYRALGLRDIDLGYAGRLPGHHPVHSCLPNLMTRARTLCYLYIAIPGRTP